jgi:uncharacterized protein YndB with AHSA1/START domain
MSNPTNTVRIHRVFKAPAKRVYKAFINPDAQSQWLPPYGFTCKVHSFDPVKGGKFKMSFTNFTNDHSHSFGGEFLELQPEKLIKYTDRFDDPNLPGEMLVTVSLREVMGVTEVHITQENVPSAIPVEMCHLGWNESLKKLARLVEPEINQ